MSLNPVKKMEISKVVTVELIVFRVILYRFRYLNLMQMMAKVDHGGAGSIDHILYGVLNKEPSAMVATIAPRASLHPYYFIML